MKKTIAYKWADALESGDYPQAVGALRTKEGFCCLGVLCNLHAQAYPATAARELHPHIYMGQTGELPGPVVEWAGMSSSDGTPITGCITIYNNPDSPRISEDLITANDDKKHSFSKIAKWIRENCKNL